MTTGFIKIYMMKCVMMELDYFMILKNLIDINF